MDCLQFCRWLESRDTHDISVADKAMKHAASCSHCQDRLRFDEHLDGLISRTMAKEAPPSGLEAKVDMILETTAVKRAPRLVGLYGALAAVLAVMVLLVVPFWPDTSIIRSIDEMSQYVIADHRGHGDGQLIVDHPGNLGSLGTLGVSYDTIRAELPSSFVFVGARICPLGECEAFHLVFRDGGNRVSLYLVTSENVGFPLSRDKRYSISAGHQTVQLWQKGGYVYTLIA